MEDGLVVPPMIEQRVAVCTSTYTSRETGNTHPPKNLHMNVRSSLIHHSTGGNAPDVHRPAGVASVVESLLDSRDPVPLRNRRPVSLQAVSVVAHAWVFGPGPGPGLTPSKWLSRERACSSPMGLERRRAFGPVSSWALRPLL